MNKKILTFIKVIFVIIILSVALQWLLPSLTSEEFQRFVVSIGPLGPLVVIFYTVLSHVFAPVAGTPGVMLGFAVFGVRKTMTYLYIASMISASINFYIARRFGRGWVTKLAGKKTMKDIDDFVSVSGSKVLAACRVFGFPIFEIISYAAGLTNISFKKYMLITAVFYLIPNFTFAYVLKDTDFTKPQNLLLWLGGLIVIGLVFTVALKSFVSNRKNNRKKEVK